MPCFCWIDDNEISEEMQKIRKHAKSIIRLAKKIHGKGNLYPSDRSTPLPRHIMTDVIDLLNDLWAGKCKETGKYLNV
jgi:hypothetical protein